MIHILNKYYQNIEVHGEDFMDIISDEETIFHNRSYSCLRNDSLYNAL